MSNGSGGIVKRWVGGRLTGAGTAERLAELDAVVARQEALIRDAVGDLTDRLAALERRITALEGGVEDA